MLNHKEADKTAGSGNCGKKAQSIAESQNSPGQQPKARESSYSDEELQHAAGVVWPPIVCENLYPVASGDRGSGRCGLMQTKTPMRLLQKLDQDRSDARRSGNPRERWPSQALDAIGADVAEF